MTRSTIPKCAVCGSRTHWVDTHWVCTRQACGSEWDADHGPEFAHPGQEAEDYPRGREVSAALTEVRTVLQRARNALDSRGSKLGTPGAPTEYSFADADGHRLPEMIVWRDPDADAIAEDLRAVVARLARWEKRGTPLKPSSQTRSSSTNTDPPPHATTRA